MGKNLDGEMFGLGMVSINLYMLFYAGEIQNSISRWLEMATYFFFQVWVRFARADKAVALQYCTTTSEAQTQRMRRFYLRYCR